MLAAEFLEGLFGVLDELFAVVFLIHSVRNGLYLLFPGNLPVFIPIRLDGSRRDFFQGFLRASIHRLVHRNDLGGIGSGDLLEGLRGETGCGVVDGLRFGIAKQLL